MTASLKILVPEATVNFIENPEIRFSTTGWTASGATISRSFDYARFGIASLKVITGNTNISEGAYYRVNYLNGTSDHVTVSAYVRGTGHVRIRLIDNISGKEWASKETVLRTDTWKRMSVTGWYGGGNDARLYVETFGTVKQLATFYVDGAQMEIKSYPTSYCDGSQDGCRWDGVDHASLSLRNILTRAGGKWVTVAGSEREREDIYMTMVTGMGTNPVVNNKETYSLAPGGFVNNTKLTERLITLTFHTKNEVIPRTSRAVTSVNKLHELRQMLLDIIKPDGVGGNQPFWIEYLHGETPLYAQVYYNGGLEGDWDIRNGWVMEFQLNLVAENGIFVEDNQDTAQFDFSDTSIFSGIAGRIDGEWKNMDGGIWNNYDPTQDADVIDGIIKDMHVGTHGELYAVGRFKTINYNGTVAPNEPADCAAYWDGYHWTAF